MTILRNINALRRTLMRGLTRNIGTAYLNADADISGNLNIRKVLICRPNHRLGNQLLITPLIQEVIRTFPHCEIDLFVKGPLAPTLFKNYRNIRQIIKLPKKPFKNILEYVQGWASIKTNHYDLAINAVKNSSSGKLAVQFANSKFKVFGEFNNAGQLKNKDHEHLAKNSVYYFRAYLAKHGIESHGIKMPSLNLKLSKFEIDEGKKILDTLVSGEKKTISLYTYATGEKCFSESFWSILYGRIKAEYPDHNIIEILPIENISNLSLKAPTYYSTDIREIGSLIANTEVFIGADSGIMHLASAVHTPTIGLFTVSDATIYGPYNNHSVALKLVSGADECIEALNAVLRHKITVVAAG